MPSARRSEVLRSKLRQEDLQCFISYFQRFISYFIRFIYLIIRVSMVGFYGIQVPPPLPAFPGSWKVQAPPEERQEPGAKAKAKAEGGGNGAKEAL